MPVPLNCCDKIELSSTLSSTTSTHVSTSCWTRTSSSPTLPCSLKLPLLSTTSRFVSLIRSSDSIWVSIFFCSLPSCPARAQHQPLPPIGRPASPPSSVKLPSRRPCSPSSPLAVLRFIQASPPSGPAVKRPSASPPRFQRPALFPPPRLRCCALPWITTPADGGLGTRCRAG